MNDTKSQIEQFFEKYAGHLNAALGDRPVVDIDEVARQFAEYFVEATPSTVSGGDNDHDFRARLPRMYEFYREHGVRSMTMTTSEVTQLDEMHWMAKVRWQVEYLSNAEQRETFEYDVIYLLQMRDGMPRLFATISPDEQRILRERGLIQPDVSAGVIG